MNDESTPDRITIVIPVLNDVDALNQLLPRLQVFRETGHEVLVVDGGSNDGSVSSARSLADRVLMTGTGRGRQMNLGAENARHEILLFLHADSILPEDGVSKICQALARKEAQWGRFDVRFNSRGILFSVIAMMMNLRSRVTGVATGDQGIFVRKQGFHQAGGFEAIALMEDIALSKALRRISWPVALSSRITTSARRWKNQGVLKTVLLMWTLRLAYFIGVSPDRLAALYYPSQSPARSDNGDDRG